MYLINKFKEIFKLFLAKRLFLIYLGSYAIIFVFISVIFISTSKSSLNFNLSETKKNDLSSLFTVRSLYDEYFAEIEQNCYKVLSSTNIDNLSKFHNSMSSAQLSEQYKLIINDLQSITDRRQFVLESFVVLNDYDIVLDSSGKYTKDTAFLAHFSPFFSSTQEWLKTISNVRFGELTTFSSKNGKNLTALVYRYPFFNQKTKFELIIVLNTQMINSHLAAHINDTSKKLYIINKESIPIFASLPDDYFTQQKPIDKFEDSGYIISSIPSGTLREYKYVQHTDYKAFAKNYHNLRLFMLISFSICLIVCCIFAYAFSKKSYYPIVEIMKILGHDKNDGTRIDEFSYIQNGLKSLMQDHSILSDKFTMLQNKSNTAVFINYLHRKHAMLEKDFFETIKTPVSISDENKYMIVLFDATDNCTDLSEDSFDTDTLFFLIENVLSDLANNQFYLYFSPDDDVLVLLLYYNENTVTNEHITSLLNLMIEIFNKELNVSLTASLSSVTSRFDELPLLYEQALEAFSDTFVLSKSSISSYDNILNAPIKYYYNISAENHLRKLIFDGNFDSAEKFIDELWNKNILNSNIHPKTASLFITDLYVGLLKISLELNISESTTNKYIDIFSIKKSRLTKKELENIKNNILTFTKTLCSNFTTTESMETNKPKCIAVKEYIEKNFQDYTLCSSKIANHMGLSINYISRIFRAEYNIGISDYITKCRIEYSKKLLLDTNKTIESISKEIGFSNSGTFIRAFKHFIGITPGQYRIQ